MKKRIAILLIVLLLAGLLGCGSAEAPAQAQSRQVSESEMETAVAAFLSALGGPSTVRLCGGSEIAYTPGSGTADKWVISDSELTAEALFDALKEQLAPYGFFAQISSSSRRLVVRAGVDSIGLTVWNSAGQEGAVKLSMTHAADCYSPEYLSRCQEQMPALIAGKSALEQLPENFEIQWNGGSTLRRKDGSWLSSTVYTLDGRKWLRCSAALLQPDGTYRYVQWNKSEAVGQVSVRFTQTHNTLEDCLDEAFDTDGSNEYCSLSTWLQMCTDFENGTTDTYWMDAITGDFIKAGETTIAGVRCQVVVCDNDWQYSEYAFDPQTGILFRHVTKNYNGDKQTTFLVNKFIVDP